jgi:hypothetical protein
MLKVASKKMSEGITHDFYLIEKASEQFLLKNLHVVRWPVYVGNYIPASHASYLDVNKVWVPVEYYSRYLKVRESTYFTASWLI